ncbi:hypothetical protein MA16_Dca004215 [Dendrobium catenatum]|uniref:Uncharacterized protein n=1 Tax=Dendrobium catenatum TaxID=906689 RepID=A0A2I0W6U1_9ASPA|nr:hypothetical protein MA16_Dca004215 [Dendrobium catenatum]
MNIAACCPKCIALSAGLDFRVNLPQIEGMLSILFCRCYRFPAVNRLFGRRKLRYRTANAKPPVMSLHRRYLTGGYRRPPAELPWTSGGVHRRLQPPDTAGNLTGGLPALAVGLANTRRPL